MNRISRPRTFFYSRAASGDYGHQGAFGMAAGLSFVRFQCGAQGEISYNTFSLI